MSWWGTLEARFYGDSERLTVEGIMRDVPTGSESGPEGYPTDYRPEAAQFLEFGVRVGGRLRDVRDTFDSPTVLAWFVEACDFWVQYGALLWELDDGPRYRYTWTPEGGLVKEKGVLDL